MPSTYQIAAHLGKDKDLTRVEAESQFGRSVRELFARIRPTKIIETGTYFGTGTTAIIARALRELKIDNPQFVSIEANPRHLFRARGNLAAANLDVELLNALSLPRAMLPVLREIKHELVDRVMADDIVVDHEEAERAAKYLAETEFNDIPDNALGATLARFDYRPDFVLLDSGGHMGFTEFLYTIDLLRGPCHIALDDIYHVKHYRSFEFIRRSPRFRISTVSEEKFGFCIARFTPRETKKGP